MRVRRTTPGFLPQLWWVLSRAAVKRMREPLSIFTDVAIFALTGGPADGWAFRLASQGGGYAGAARRMRCSADALAAELA